MTTRNDLIPIGETAPDFSVRASDGGTVSLAAFRGKKQVLLVFYPGDNTPVCTAQLCAFRDARRDWEAEDTVIFGVNPAGEAKHANFAAKHNFPFPLLIDEGNALAAQYGCKGWFGFVKRSVYVINKAGRVAYASRGNPAPASVLRSLISMQEKLTVLQDKPDTSA